MAGSDQGGTKTLKLVASKKIQAALTGVTPADMPSDVTLVEYVTRRYHPPAYLTKMVLMLLTGSRLRVGGDKSAWTQAVAFRGKTWVLWDWKRYAWNLAGPEDSENDAQALVMKLLAAGEIVNKQIYKQGKALIESDNISLQNQYHRTKHLYRHFMEQTRAVLSDPPPSINRQTPDGGDTGPLPDLASVLNESTRRTNTAWANCAATVVFFFAHLEAIMDSCFAFGDRKGLTFNQYRAKRWPERFKALLPVSEKAIESLYVALDLARKSHRNPVAHSDPVFFLPVEGHGLIPVSYEHIFEPRFEVPFQFQEEEAERLFTLFEETLELFRTREETRFAYEYARSGLPIHLHRDAIAELEQHMGSMEDFQEELARRSAYQDAVDNMDV